MINRELIRIKVVQLLYSYLLVENPFSLESQPSAPTKEKRFAFALYLDLLYLITRIAERVEYKKHKPLAETRFVRNVLADEKIRSLMARTAESPAAFAALEARLADDIKNSGIYKLYLKGIEAGKPDDNVWKNIFNIILMNDAALNSEIAGRENYTLKGVDRMKEMMELTFANFFASADNIQDALKILETSMEKTRELYIRLLCLPIAITELRERDIDNARLKLLQTEEDLNPNLRFVENEFVKALGENCALHEQREKYHVNWLADDENIVRSLLRKIMQSEVYQNYMALGVMDFKTECDFWRDIYRHIIFMDDDFMEYLEEKSVFWNDDIDILGTFIIKTIKKCSKATPAEVREDDFILPKYKDEEDARFGAELFTYVIKDKEYYRQLILDNVNTEQWDMERLAFMDIVIIMTALAEIMHFPKIPLTVSFNEYIEIAKYYSTAKSGVFVNGFLAQIVEELRKEGKIVKTF